MTGTAVLILLAAIIIIWGGVAVSFTALFWGGRGVYGAAGGEPAARAREHMLHPEQID